MYSRSYQLKSIMKKIFLALHKQLVLLFMVTVYGEIVKKSC